MLRMYVGSSKAEIHAVALPSLVPPKAGRCSGIMAWGEVLVCRERQELKTFTSSGRL